MYIVLGATHPNLIREQGERYRIGLERLAKDLGIKKTSASTIVSSRSTN